MSEKLEESHNGSVNVQPLVIQTFDVYTLTTADNNSNLGYCHWSEGLKMIIKKNDVIIELDSDEIKKLLKSLPRTVSGVR